MFAFTNKQRAVAEAERRKGDVATYTTPLPIGNETRLFLSDFYRNTIYGRVEEMKLILEDNPNTVGKHYKGLVPQKLPSEEFWQRYYYRCTDLERIQKEIEADDAAKRKQRNETFSAAMNSMQNMVTRYNGNTGVDPKDDVIFQSRHEESDEDEPVQFEMEPFVETMVEKVLDAAETVEDGLANLDSTMSAEEKKEEVDTPEPAKDAEVVETKTEEEYGEETTELSEAEVAKRKKRNAKKRAKKAAARDQSPVPPIRDNDSTAEDETTEDQTVTKDENGQANDDEKTTTELSEAEISKRKKRNAKKRAKKAAARAMSRSRSPQPPANQNDIPCNVSNSADASTSVDSHQMDTPVKEEAISVDASDLEKDFESETKLVVEEQDKLSTLAEEETEMMPEEEPKPEDSTKETSAKKVDVTPQKSSSVFSTEEEAQSDDGSEHMAGSPNCVMFQAFHDQAMVDKKLQKEAVTTQTSASEAGPQESEMEAPWDEEAAQDCVQPGQKDVALEVDAPAAVDTTTVKTTTVDAEVETKKSSKDEASVAADSTIVKDNEASVEVDVEGNVIVEENKPALDETSSFDSDAASGEDKTEKKANQSVISSEKAVVADKEKAMQRIHVGLSALIIAFALGVLAVAGTDWTMLGNKLCSPLAPYQVLNKSESNNHELRSVAPWWVPASYKPNAFSQICGSDRIQTALEWKPQEKRGPILAIHSAENQNGKPLIKRKGVQKATVNGASLEVTTKRRRWFSRAEKTMTETIRAPWAKSSQGNTN